MAIFLLSGTVVEKIFGHEIRNEIVFRKSKQNVIFRNMLVFSENTH